MKGGGLLVKNNMLNSHGSVTSLRLVEQTIAGNVDSETTDWLAAGFTKWMAGNGDLDSCLFLDRASRLRQRNAALFEACRILDDDDCGAWILAGRLASAIRRYQKRIAPILRRNPDYSIGDLDRALHTACSAGRPPATQRRLFDLIR